MWKMILIWTIFIVAWRITHFNSKKKKSVRNHVSGNLTGWFGVVVGQWRLLIEWPVQNVAVIFRLQKTWFVFFFIHIDCNHWPCSEEKKKKTRNFWLNLKYQHRSFNFRFVAHLFIIFIKCERYDDWSKMIDDYMDANKNVAHRETDRGREKDMCIWLQWKIANQSHRCRGKHRFATF